MEIMNAEFALRIAISLLLLITRNIRTFQKYGNSSGKKEIRNSAAQS